MLAAPVAELLQFQPVRCRLSVLGSRIVPFFAITALHGNDLSGHKNLLFSGAKAPESPRFPARLKPCPDTNLRQVEQGEPRRARCGIHESQFLLF